MSTAQAGTSAAARHETRLRTLFEENSSRVLAYACRHVGHSAAQDVVSDVFLVAWRRIDHVPAEALPWLLVVARNTIATRRRSVARHLRLVDELAAFERSTTVAAGADETAVQRRAMFSALADLSATDREAVLLTGWDGLTVAQAAEVAGCSRRAFELRLHRARTRLRRRLAADDTDDIEDRAHPVRPAHGRLKIAKEVTS